MKKDKPVKKIVEEDEEFWIWERLIEKKLQREGKWVKEMRRFSEFPNLNFPSNSNQWSRSLFINDRDRLGSFSSVWISKNAHREFVDCSTSSQLPATTAQHRERHLFESMQNHPKQYVSHPRVDDKSSTSRQEALFRQEYSFSRFTIDYGVWGEVKFRTLSLTVYVFTDKPSESTR
ncbi:hypothetical protein TIFTF001_029399 [Ficus carica]|uniref:Uncharacterized protein n=1 Tax=Ficus carica TaxID=3494 RepID=A0AA88DRG2_FICCA|nr:hypothetical protein TIFTF001_029399 [Ficus carica]